jgi:hypothetical protein
MLSLLGTGEIIILFIFGVLPFLLLLFALIDLLRSNFKGYDKLVWALVVIFIPVIGAILYFVIGRNQKVGTL